MNYNDFFESALSAAYKKAPMTDDDTFMRIVKERAKNMKKENSEHNGLVEVTTDYTEPKKSTKILHAAAGIAGTAAVLTGAVFGLNWLNEHGGLKGPDVQGAGAGYHEDVESAENETETEEIESDVVSEEDADANNKTSSDMSLEYDDCTIVITDYRFDGLRLDLTYDYYPKYLQGGYHILLGSTATNIGSAFGTTDMEAFEKHKPSPSYGNKTSYMLFSPANEIDVGFITEIDNQEVLPPEIVRRIDDNEVGGINCDLRRETVKGIVHCTLPVNTEQAVGLVAAPAWVEQPNGKMLKLDRMYIADSVIMCVYPNVSEDVFDEWNDDIADMNVSLGGETDDIKMSETPLYPYEQYISDRCGRHCKFGDTIYTFYYSDREFGCDDVRAVYLGGKCVISKDGNTNTFYQPSCFQSFYIPPEEDRKSLTDAHVETEKCDINVNWLAFDGMTLVLQYDVTFKNGLPEDGSVVPIWAFGDNTEKPYTTHGSRVDKLGANGDTVSYIGEIVYNRVIFDEPIKIYFMDDHTWASEVFIPFDEKNTGIIVFMPEELPRIGTSTYNIGKEVTLLSGKKINVESVTLGDYSVMITFDCETVFGFDTHDTYLVMNDGSIIDLDSLENKGGTLVENSQNIYHFILSEKLNIAQVKEIYVCGECVYGDTEPIPTMQQEELPVETTADDIEAETTE